MYVRTRTSPSQTQPRTRGTPQCSARIFNCTYRLPESALAHANILRNVATATRVPRQSEAAAAAFRLPAAVPAVEEEQYAPSPSPSPPPRDLRASESAAAARRPLPASTPRPPVGKGRLRSRPGPCRTRCRLAPLQRRGRQNLASDALARLAGRLQCRRRYRHVPAPFSVRPSRVPSGRRRRDSRNPHHMPPLLNAFTDVYGWVGRYRPTSLLGEVNAQPRIHLSRAVLPSCARESPLRATALRAPVFLRYARASPATSWEGGGGGGGRVRPICRPRARRRGQRRTHTMRGGAPGGGALRLWRWRVAVAAVAGAAVTGWVF